MQNHLKNAAKSVATRAAAGALVASSIGAAHAETALPDTAGIVTYIAGAAAAMIALFVGKYALDGIVVAAKYLRRAIRG